ncbi:hypothetical protein MSAN_00326800 [Mycena sanguinolenta]|uniref:Uncharacterized protein n=1 Tax=Mycena sanguinolenta TaxID=230812 RepID=A0A8H7DIG2_9AGAR|nr:hypothetical protein MSAN_00326800 [Mycena sanguinolenta]
MSPYKPISSSHFDRREGKMKGTDTAGKARIVTTTFIHAFAISLVDDPSTFLGKSGRSFVPYGSQGSSFTWFSFSGNGTSNGGKQYSAPASAVGNGIVTDAFPAPKVIHPSQIIHERIFREVPQAKVVITHDDDWRDVLKDDGVQTQELTVSELQEAIFDRFEIMEEDGAVFLRAKSGPTASRNAATITVEELHPIDDQITNDPRDDLNLLSQKDLREIPDEEQDRNIAERDIRPSSTDNPRVQLDPVLDTGNLRSPRDHSGAPLSSYSEHSEPGIVDQRGAGSFFSGSRDFRVSGGELYNTQGNMNTVSDGASYTMSRSHNRTSNRDTGDKNIFGLQHPSLTHREGRGGFAPNQYQAPPNPTYGDPNARFPGNRPSAPSMLYASARIRPQAISSSFGPLQYGTNDEYPV